ncbi:MAG: hypothetical protein JRI70_01955, partial [Deltaproteobacteria bacterium]|nr:hypothetical protein [Deltaproteobacteria bacterium]
MTRKEAPSYLEPDKFGSNISTEQLDKWLNDAGKEEIAYVHLETCPEAWNGQPFSFANLQAVSASCRAHSIPVVIDISHVLENAFWIQRVERKDREIMEITREIISLADIVLMDASQDCRS